jgi:hypothetical protein
MEENRNKKKKNYGNRPNFKGRDDNRPVRKYRDFSEEEKDDAEDNGIANYIGNDGDIYNGEN